ncbi:DUF488 family protein [Chloroflexus sp. MS-CIW-1]|jgi:uncharacterized protein (DUF488 family)|uniref:DUF488 domain-containing protein n=1 Tax=Chloroflexus sp. MS-CIW-1 TaxID=3055768 RepID=UPI0026494BC3|nr:DUF488 domain-containing protein [Chloroflexus sp. MS-CIW-1]MDN5272009.1 DUF488 family protein [Chloroflexus sp. MS-CIW-1]
MNGMLYRRKILLAFIDIFGGTIDKLYLQKMLFLLGQHQEKPVYEFIPYHYGSYSFTVQWDINALCDRALLQEDEYTITLLEKRDYLQGLHPRDAQTMHALWSKYRKTSRNELLQELYEQYPYYATRSKLLNEVLGKEAQQRVEQFRHVEQRTVLFTVGYEGRSLEHYLNILIRNGINLLVDVRNNPASMKPGFSKRQLERICKLVDIEYRHFPEVGIAPELRKGLRAQDDYDDLFAAYRRTILPTTLPTQREILNLLQQYRRIALTCFEAESQRCHRRHLAEAISKLPGFTYDVIHL